LIEQYFRDLCILIGYWQVTRILTNTRLICLGGVAHFHLLDFPF